MLAPTEKVNVWLVVPEPEEGVVCASTLAAKVTPGGANPAALVCPAGGVAPDGRDALRVLSPMYQEMRRPAVVAAVAAVWPNV